jgi:ubiquinone/menaquinone biosynthesis C-methylase UbiE
MNFFYTNIKKIPYIRKIISILHPFLFPILEFIAVRFLKMTTFFYSILMGMDWGKIPRTEWMDHDQDTFFQFNSSGNFFHFERGLIPRMLVSKIFFKKKDFESLLIEKNINILDLCSGDSYISQKFFFDCSNKVVSIDLDRAALQRGRARLKREKFLNQNHSFLQCDIEKQDLQNFLKKNNIDYNFDLVLFNAAIEHFKLEQLDYIFDSAKKVMKSKGIFFTYTIVEDENKQNYLPEHHEMFFKGSKNLSKVVGKYFANTKTYENLVNKRHNIYCVASNHFKDLSL